MVAPGVIRRGPQSTLQSVQTLELCFDSRDVAGRLPTGTYLKRIQQSRTSIINGPEKAMYQSQLGLLLSMSTFIPNSAYPS